MSFVGVFVGQWQTSRREQRAADRRQARVRALFASRTERVAAYFILQANSNGIIYHPPSVRKALERLQRLARETALVLDLEPAAITALHRALRTAERDLESFEIAVADRPPDEPEPAVEGQFYEYMAAKLRPLLEASATAFRALLAAPDVKDIEVPQLLVAIPEPPAALKSAPERSKRREQQARSG